MDIARNNISISVIIAVYNAEKYIENTLKSVQAQSLKEIEIICVDDGSTDNSLSILKEYEKLDRRITVLRQEEQTDGAAAARNLGISCACGKYLAILDSDDFFEQDMLELAYKEAESTGAEIVIYDGYVFDEQEQRDKEVGFILRHEYLPQGKRVFSPKENKEQLFQMTLGAAWNCLMRKDLIDKNKIYFHSLHHADDLGFVYTAFACADKIVILNKRLIHYRINNSGSQAANISKWPETAYQALVQLKEELISRNHYFDYKVSFVKEVMIYVIFYLDGMREYSAFEKLYNQLKERYLEELGTYDISDHQFKNPYWVIVRDFIHSEKAGEYLFRRMYQIAPFSSIVAWKKKIPINARIVIYGAGNIGRNVFSEIIKEKEYRIQAWVDQGYQKIGYPVISPEEISNLRFDYILIAVATEGLYCSILQYLMKCGIERTQICWTGDM